MTLRAVPATLTPPIVKAIDLTLDGIVRDQGVTIPLAIESGSRAWGFPSPDSDYDCRFIFVRRLDDYLSPWLQRDVIEIPLEGELDVNGWDLGKALKLMLKGNAVLIEWLHSPIIYRGDAEFRDDLLALAQRHASRAAIARHYLNVGESQRQLHLADATAVPIKKLFYALRPAAALRWLRLHRHAALVPMHLPTLIAECEPPTGVAAIVARLIARKAETREHGLERLPEALGTFMADEFAAARTALAGPVAPPSQAALIEAAAFFREAVRRFDRLTTG